MSAMRKSGEVEMTHTFDVDVALIVGIKAAILFQNIAFWCEHSEANGTNYHNGKYWTYASNKALQKLFPYLSERQIRDALKSLFDARLIEKGNYNKMPFDRTIWYSLTEKGKSMREKTRLDVTKMSNGAAENVRPIPDVITDINTDVINIPVLDDGFDEFYALYPKKKAKKDALKAWKALNPNRELRETIRQDIEARLRGDWGKRDRFQYIPFPATYLRGQRWEDESEMRTNAKPARPADEDLFAGLTEEQIAEYERLANDGHHFG